MIYPTDLNISEHVHQTKDGIYLTVRINYAGLDVSSRSGLIENHEIEGDVDEYRTYLIRGLSRIILEMYISERYYYRSTGKLKRKKDIKIIQRIEDHFKNFDWNIL